MRILIVAASELAHDMRDVLTKRGHDAGVVTGDDEAYALLAGDTAYAYRVVIADALVMREPDAAVLMRQLRALRKPGDPYRFVILLTTRDRSEGRRLASGAGADDLLATPFDIDELLARLMMAERVIGLEDAVTQAAAWMPPPPELTPPETWDDDYFDYSGLEADYAVELGTAEQEKIAAERDEMASREETAKRLVLGAIRDLKGMEVHFLTNAKGGYDGHVRLPSYKLVPLGADARETQIAGEYFRSIGGPGWWAAKRHFLSSDDAPVVEVFVSVLLFLYAEAHVCVRVQNVFGAPENDITLPELPIGYQMSSRLGDLLIEGRQSGGVLLLHGNLADTWLIKATARALYNHVKSPGSLTIRVDNAHMDNLHVPITEILAQSPDVLFVNELMYSVTPVGLAVQAALKGLFVIMYRQAKDRKSALMLSRGIDMKQERLETALIGVLSIQPLAADGSNAGNRYELKTADELFAE